MLGGAARALGAARSNVPQRKSLLVSTKPDVPMHFDNILRERLQNSDRKGVIDLYYELLSSGHSVGEILESLGDIQCKSEHGDAKHQPADNQQQNLSLGSWRMCAFPTRNFGDREQRGRSFS